MATSSSPINVLPSWGTNKVAINYKLGWNSPDFVAYLKEWLRIPRNLKLVLEDDDFTQIPARVVRLALLHRKCFVISSKREVDGLSVLRYDATVESVGKGNPSIHPELVSMREMQKESVSIIYPLVLEAAKDLLATEKEGPREPTGPSVWLTVTTPDGRELEGLFHAMESVDSCAEYTDIKTWGDLVSDTHGTLRKFVEYATTVKTLEFLVKGQPKSTGHITIMDMLTGDPETEHRLGRTHRELSKRHDVVTIYQEASVAKELVKTAILEDPHKTYKQQTFT
jgi:hypothetical protein